MKIHRGRQSQIMLRIRSRICEITDYQSLIRAMDVAQVLSTHVRNCGGRRRSREVALPE